MIKYGKASFKIVFILSVISSIFSAVIVTYESLPESVRDSLPLTFKEILTFLTLFSTGLATLVHALNSSFAKSPNPIIFDESDKK